MSTCTFFQRSNTSVAKYKEINFKFERNIVFDITKKNYPDEQSIYLYKNWVIVIDQHDFAIYDMATKQKQVSFEDLIRDDWAWFLHPSIKSSNIYKNYIIMFFKIEASEDNPKIMLFDLETLKVKKLVSIEYADIPDYMNISDDCLGLYAKLSINDSVQQEIKYQLYEFPKCVYKEGGTSKISQSIIIEVFMIELDKIIFNRCMEEEPIFSRQLLKNRNLYDKKFIHCANNSQELNLKKDGSWVFDAYFDLENHRIAVLYNGIIAIYK